ncbi:MAG: hypothetical protein ACLQVN_04900 [Bryobacteraceae bacterium]
MTGRVRGLVLLANRSHGRGGAGAGQSTPRSRVAIGSLPPAASPVMVAIGPLYVNDKVEHFCAYWALSSVPVNYRLPAVF